MKKSASDDWTSQARQKRVLDRSREEWQQQRVKTSCWVSRIELGYPKKEFDGKVCRNEQNAKLDLSDSTREKRREMTVDVT